MKSALKKKELVADWDTLMRIFVRPENEATRTTLVKYMEQILFGLHDFLKQHVGITEEASLKILAERFTDTRIRKNPEKKLADVITDLIEDIAPHAVNVASPYFVGHMTSALPFFIVHLKAITAALNQNVVKLETSKIMSIVEKQVLAKIHRLIFNRGQAFYDQYVQDTESTLGSMVEGGTLANMTALWVARNTLFAPKNGFFGVEKEGIHAAYEAYDTDRCIVLVSRLGHHSLRKAGGVLGIGNQNVIAVDVDENMRVDLLKLENEIKKTRETKTRVIAVVGIAGTTETGSIDPLDQIGDICRKYNIHFHVDAAWGGPTLMSDKYKGFLNGIEKADSVTIDGHKQFYMPMGCGMVYFKNPLHMDSVAYHANYINRRGSVDLGIRSLSGSREATSLILDCTLKIMGSRGYALLIEHGIETARRFAEEINKRADFELITYPELNILTYRICPGHLQGNKKRALHQCPIEADDRLNDINMTVQRLQREAGRSFVSRTTLKRCNRRDTVVLRAVIMNPMTDMAILRDILDEQEAIFQAYFPEMTTAGKA